jgi:invasion protein IalB
MFLGTPHYGAPQAVRAFAEGYKLGSDGGVFGVLQDFISRVTVEKQLNSHGALFPSFYQLLPIYDDNCARTGRSNLVLPKSVVSLNRQANLFSAKVWREIGWPKFLPEGVSEKDYYKSLSGFLSNAHSFLCVVSNVKFPKGVKITDFAAIDHQTVTHLKLNKTPTSGKPRLRGRAQAVDVGRGEPIGFDAVGNGDGDGTVPFEIAGDWMQGVNYRRYYPQETHEYLLDSALFKEKINSIYRYARARVDERLLSNPDRFERMKKVFLGLDKNIFLGVPLPEDMIVKGGKFESVSDSFPKILEFNKELMKARGLTKDELLALAGDEGRPRREAQALLGGLGFTDEPREDLRLVYAPWSKFCGNDTAAGGGRTCFLATEVRTQGGVAVMAASLIERDRQPKKVMRITIAGPLQLRYGARAIIDEDQLLRAPFFTCYANACMADFPVAGNIARKLRKARTLTLEAISLDGAAVSFDVPMASFREGQDGPGADMKLFEDQEKEFLVQAGNVAVGQQGEPIDVPRTHFATSADAKVAVSKAMASFWAPLSRVVMSNADAAALEGRQFLAAIRGAVFANALSEWSDLLGLNAAAADNSSNRRRRRLTGSPSESAVGGVNSLSRQSSN